MGETRFKLVYLKKNALRYSLLFILSHIILLDAEDFIARWMCLFFFQVEFYEATLKNITQNF